MMFYDKYKALCEKKGVSCNRAALEIVLSSATPTKWKKTGATPDGATLAKLAAYFGVSVGSLLDAEGQAAEDGRPMGDEALKFALWGDCGDISDENLEDVKRYAAFVRERKRKK